MLLFMLAIIVRPQREGIWRQVSPTSTCWEHPGCLHLHLLLCWNSIHKRRTVTEIRQKRVSLNACIHLTHLKRERERERGEKSRRSPQSVRQLIWASEAPGADVPYLVLLPPLWAAHTVFSDKLLSLLYSINLLFKKWSHNSTSCIFKVPMFRMWYF